MEQKKANRKRGTTLYRLNRSVEDRGKKLVEIGYHNTMSDLVEYATLQHVLYLEKLLERREER